MWHDERPKLRRYEHGFLRGPSGVAPFGCRLKSFAPRGRDPTLSNPSPNVENLSHTSESGGATETNSDLGHRAAHVEHAAAQMAFVLR